VGIFARCSTGCIRSPNLFTRPIPDTGLPVKADHEGHKYLRRIFLGSMYVLGTTSPDTMVKARDAMIIADKMLYSSNTTDETAPACTGL
jgi:hypothetical protein